MLPALVAAVMAAALALVALLPEAALAPHLTLIDRDDSLHPLSPAQLSAVRQVFALLAGAAAALACALAYRRREIGQTLASLGEEASGVLRELRLPCTLSFAVILGAGLLARLALLDGPMRFDESDTYNYFASRSFFNTLTDYTAPNNHILHSFLVRTSSLLFGVSPPALRLPALLAGLAILPLAFVLARRLFGERTAYYTMALTAVHPGLIEYSANARGYTWQIVFVLLVFLAADHLRQERNRFAWLLFVAAGSLGMFTIPTMVYPLATASIWAFWRATPARRGRLAREIGAAALAIAAASICFYAPAAARTGVDGIVANRYVVSVTWQIAQAKLQSTAADSWSLWTNHLPAPIWLGFAVAALLGLQLRESRQMLAAIILTACALMALQRVVPYARVFLYAAPFVCMVAAAGLGRLTFKSWAAPALALGVGATVVAGHVWFPTDREHLYREVAAAAPAIVEAAGSDGVVLAALPLSEPIRYELVASGGSRNQILTPTFGTGQVPNLEGHDAVIVVRPILRNPRPGYWFPFDSPALEELSSREPLFEGSRVEVVRFER